LLRAGVGPAGRARPLPPRMLGDVRGQDRSCAAGHPGSGTRLEPSYFHILSIGICSAAELSARATPYRHPLTRSDSLHPDKPAPCTVGLRSHASPPTMLEPSEGRGMYRTAAPPTDLPLLPQL